MGKIVVFRRRVDVMPPDASGDRVLTSGGRRDLPRAPSHKGDPTNSAAGQAQIPFNSFHATRCARDLTKTSLQPDHDAYLLVLLADQEMIAGRDAEARYLLDAAYAAFDRNIDGQLSEARG